MKKSIFLFFAAILCAMSANAINQSNVDLYFDNSTSQWTNCYVYIGHDSYTSCYSMTRVPGTQYLWKLAKGFNSGNAWNNASGWVVSKEKWWDNNGENVYKFVYHGNKNVTDIRTSVWDASTIYKADGTTSVNHFSTACTVYKWSTSTKSDYKITINTVTGGTLTVTDYDNATVTNGASKIKLTVLKFSAAASPGYTFGGVQINNGSTTTTISASDIASKTYTLTSDVTITPIWNENKYTVTINNDGDGTTTPSGAQSNVGQVTGLSINATAAENYEFVNWTITSGSGSFGSATSASTTFKPTSAATIQANFRSTATNSLTVVAGANIESVAGSTDPITLGEKYNIKATPKTGYIFEKWTADPAENATFTDDASATTDVTVLNGSVTVTASAEEVLSTLTTANEYNEGTPTIAAPTASVAKIGVTTTATVTAAAGTGYTFAGWKLDNCVRTDGGAENATTITVKSNGDGADAKVTAKYEQNVVYFVNTKGWSTVKVYAWNDGGSKNAEWSGLALTAANVVKQIGGCDVYKYVPGDNYAKVIFNNGSEQTDDLTWQNGKYYVYNSENTKDVSDWYDESEVEGVLPDPVQLTYTVEVPAGTHECYIAGDMNGWALTKMDPVDATHFTLTIQWATNADKYKYACGESWDYVELKADGSEVADRSYSENDVVEKWSTLAKCYLMGNGDWVNGVEMEYDSENGQYILLCHHISAPFKFKLGDEWSDQVENDSENEVDWVESEPGSGLYNITLPEGNYNFYFKKDSKKVYIEVSNPALSRTVPVGYYATVCLSQNIIKVVGATLFEVAGKDGDKVIFDEVLTPVAGMPYIFLAEENTISFYCGIETAATPGNHKSLHGTFDNMADDELDGMYMVQNNKIVKCAATGCNIPANRAYFNGTELEALGVPPTPMPGRRRITMGAEGENTTTGVEGIIVPEGQTIKVISNGQLIIIHNGEMYNAQGIKL